MFAHPFLSQTTRGLSCSHQLPSVCNPGAGADFQRVTCSHSPLFSSSFLDGSGIDDSPSTQFAELWDHLDHTMFFPDFRPFLSSSSLDQDSRDNERGHQAHADLWGPSRPPRLPMTRRYRSRGSSRPDRSPAIEGIIQQIFAGFFANSAIPGSQHPFSWSGMLHSNPGDYAWGQSGLDAIVTQLLGQLENTGPPPADKEKISSLPTVTVTQEQVGRWNQAPRGRCCSCPELPPPLLGLCSALALPWLPRAPGRLRPPEFLPGLGLETLVLSSSGDPELRSCCPLGVQFLWDSQISACSSHQQRPSPSCRVFAQPLNATFLASRGPDGFTFLRTLLLVLLFAASLKLGSLWRFLPFQTGSTAPVEEPGDVFVPNFSGNVVSSSQVLAAQLPAQACGFLRTFMVLQLGIFLPVFAAGWLRGSLSLQAALLLETKTLH
uniref:Ring finger protein 115 n=1 Tax=Otus sunia TaxID=257818 RepID=A0A8C8ATD8_9STRI